MKPRLSLLLPLLPVVVLLSPLSCSTLPEPRWDPLQLTKAVILPVEIPVYGYPAYSYDKERSGRVSLAVGEAVATAWRRKGYDVTGPGEAGKVIAADPSLEDALRSLRKVARSLRAGRNQVNQDSERLASAFSAQLVILTWGRAEYSPAGYFGRQGREDHDRGWEDRILLEYAVLDGGGRPLLYNMEEEIPYYEESGSLAGNVALIFSRVPGR